MNHFRYIILAYLALFLTLAASQAQAREVFVNWICPTWEAHHAYFAPAAYGDMQGHVAAANVLFAYGVCVGDLQVLAEVVHEIGEVSILNPGDPEEKRTWWKALIVRDKHGTIAYTVQRDFEHERLHHENPGIHSGLGTR